jgi:hypothetical protein
MSQYSEFVRNRTYDVLTSREIDAFVLATLRRWSA